MKEPTAQQSLRALQHLDSTDRTSQSPRPAADQFTNKTRSSSLQLKFFFPTDVQAEEILILHCFRKHISVCLYSCWRYMEVQMLEDYFFSGCSCKIGKAEALRHLLASIYLFANPRGYLIALQCTANTWSVSIGYKAALLTDGVPVVYLATGFNLRPVFPLQLRSILFHYYSKDAWCIDAPSDSKGFVVWPSVILFLKCPKWSHYSHPMVVGFNGPVGSNVLLVWPDKDGIISGAREAREHCTARQRDSAGCCFHLMS